VNVVQAPGPGERPAHACSDFGDPLRIRSIITDGFRFHRTGAVSDRPPPSGVPVAESSELRLLYLRHVSLMQYLIGSPSLSSARRRAAWQPYRLSRLNPVVEADQLELAREVVPEAEAEGVSVSDSVCHASDATVSRPQTDRVLRSPLQRSASTHDVRLRRNLRGSLDQ
jgi:hypothetical protein